MIDSQTMFDVLHDAQRDYCRLPVPDLIEILQRVWTLENSAVEKNRIMAQATRELIAEALRTKYDDERQR